MQTSFKQDEINHSKKAEVNLCKSSKSFFEYVNERKNRKTTLPQTMRYKDRTASSEQDVVNLFA